jgi:NTP pyrophosphatase (non-canonical NTP hydrolase)
MRDVDLYQEWTATTARYPSEIYAVLGLAEEAGEVAGKYAKYVRDGWDEDKLRAALLAELGDVVWMVARVAADHGLKLSEVMDYNVDKLEDRMKRNKINGSGDHR